MVSAAMLMIINTYIQTSVLFANYLAANLSISSFLCRLIVCEGQLKNLTWHSSGLSETWLPKGSPALFSSVTPSLGEERIRDTTRLHGLGMPRNPRPP